jgi:D-sedoheptulose 7-phosphate isomerase
MKQSTENILNQLMLRQKELISVKADINYAFEIILKTYKNGNKLLLCGNGGSAADCEHIAGELLKAFRKKRDIKLETFNALKNYGEEGKMIAENLEGALPVISLTSHISFLTAFANDKMPELNFAQQLYALGNEEDTLISISTSGNSKNCVYALLTAKVKNVNTISLTGKNESKMSELSDVTIKVNETETYLIQELHLPIYHCLCAMLEEELF